jgi:ATP-dependent DNA helicase RecQ
VATKAFGLGADIPDVRNVIVTYVPDDLPDIVQMIGRAGRDGEPARAFLLWSSLALDAASDELAACTALKTATGSTSLNTSE